MKNERTIKCNRRYYLHRRIKRFASLDGRNKLGIIYVGFQQQFNEQQQYYLDELQSIGYSVQIQIPN